MARPPPSRAHDHDCLRLPPASSPQNSEAGKKESTVHRLNQLCPPCATPFSKSSLDHRRSVARVVKNGFAANSGVSESAKVVLSAPPHMCTSGVTSRELPAEGAEFLTPERQCFECHRRAFHLRKSSFVATR